MVPQEPFLFAGTVRDNIAFARPEATDDEVWEAVRAVGLVEVIERMAHGIDTEVHERGQSLSSGERQLIALARAFMARPRVLVLDEATSNLDLLSETKIEAALDVLLQGRSAILIAHRLSTAMRADRIVVIDDGSGGRERKPRGASGARRALRRDVPHLDQPHRRSGRVSGLGTLLAPRSIAVIGASNDSSRISGRILPILLQHRYAGSIYPVNPGQQIVNGLPAFPSIGAVPGPVDAAAIAVRAAAVPQVLAECAAAGVRSAVIFSSGFAEEGKDGSRAQEAMAATARDAGMRVLGPNAEGFVNVHQGIPISFSPTVDYQRGLTRLLPGNVAVVSQSGGLGFALFNGGAAVGMGMSYVVSTGNECDLGALEVAAHLLEDSSTDVIALLVEGFRPDETLGPVAARAARLGKTLVIAKLGRSEPGRRAAAAHTAHDAGQDEAYQEEFRRLGVVCVDDQQELLDVCFAVSRGRRAAGSRVGIMTTSGGAGVWLADACAAHGLTVPELDAGLQAELRALLPSYGATRNPVDVTAEVVARAGVARPLQMLVESPQVDAVVVAASLAGPQTLERERDEIASIVDSTTKPIVLYSYTTPGPASVEALIGSGLAWYASPARAARALRALVRER